MKKMKRLLFKIVSSCLVLLLISFPIFITRAEEINNEKLVIHYYRYDQNYDNWSLWLWPYGLEGSDYHFDSTDEFGVSYTLDLTTDKYANISKVGILIKDASWAKDIANDRFIDISKPTTDGILHVYFVESDQRIGYGLNDPNGPEKTDKFRSAYFKTTKQIVFSATQILNKESINLFKGDEQVNITTTVSGTTGTVTLDEEVDLNYIYTLKAMFSDNETRSYTVTFDGIYDSPSFERAYAYDGNDLGAIVSNNQTTFKVWAPLASKMILNLYNTGTPESLGGTNTPTETIEMTKSEKGVYQTTVDLDLHNTYYTYTVTNGQNNYEVVDPYAKATGINGLRGLVVNFNKVNPTGWEYNNRANNIVNATDAIIYELHVRDLTSHSSWNGKNENKAKYLGLCEEGTKYEGVSTGFDHIKELGVTHVQLLPIFDYGVVDESRLNDKYYLDGKGEGFNWGYMPLNYNSLEGGYSSNPYDGLTAIKEMKQVVMKYTNSNIRINMDVVYNHTGPSADSNFNLLVPGYYHRINANGSWSNGSGCGNETASERKMMQKFMIDSIKFWATEYNFSGFRFDLMALHDKETMNLIANTLKEVDPTIMVYGEPWNGGDSALSDSKRADKVNLKDMPLVGAFNDDIRDGVKGSVFNASEKGWIQGNAGSIDKVKYGIVGGINYPGLNFDSISYQRAWNTSPLKTINYVACHDNNTLYDKLMLTLSSQQRKNIELYQKQANAIVLLSQGIPFIHAGDEIMRSKPNLTGDGYDHNSYESPDSVNQIRWNEKVKEKQTNVFEYYKGLIKLRKNHSALRMTSADDIKNNLEFVNLNNNKLLGFRLNNNANKDQWKNILVVFNNSNQISRFTTPIGDDWSIVVNRNVAGIKVLSTIKGGTEQQILPNETLVMVQGYVDTEKPNKPNNGCCKKSNAIIAVLSSSAAIIGTSLLIIKKKND